MASMLSPCPIYLLLIEIIVVWSLYRGCGRVGFKCVQCVGQLASRKEILVLLMVGTQGILEKKRVIKRVRMVVYFNRFV